jgi:hypothetical protein
MSQNVSGCLSVIPSPEREAVEERAAILEYEANLKKPEAERQAFVEWTQAKKAREQASRADGFNERIEPLENRAF